MDKLAFQKITVRQNSKRGTVFLAINRFDFDVQQYVKKFNEEHKGKVNMLDFSQYTTKFNDFKNNPISKKDMEVIREFQKRKIDQRLHNLKTTRYGSNLCFIQSKIRIWGLRKVLSSILKMLMMTSLRLRNRFRSNSKDSPKEPTSDLSSIRNCSTLTINL